MVKIKINKIERSNRKTIALLINADSTLTVKAPLLVSSSYIEELVNKKHNWITKKVKDIQARPKPVTREYVNGEGFLYLGKSYRLKITNCSSIQLGEYLFFPKQKAEQIQQELIDWYKKQALRKLTSRASWYSKKMGVNFSSLKLSNAEKRWGSCGRSNTLSFNWRLIMAPLKILDYVVVHELTHIEEKNHSRKFWNRVKVVLSDYKKSRSWLKENSQSLII
ncbi:MAG: SprT family zinc-dependent metalloprotease [Patescibacteria group bacterium]